ncbi:HEAT repeat-containing protein 1-like [Amphibalanus amphitrite]|uniref:HEAT repeat-containing protein 1-like n=1 Tax=Amphibalanus amphitrite TaxID=1232801 RepID=UPI001C90EAE0|nr:HEAT repeat-containing protein 1-like [Amphibalanus amphitrite]
MATALGRQLARLTAPQTALVIHKKARPSLLFDKREAALLDRETIFSIGVDGFEDLVNLNPDFIKFQDTLFSENAKTMERAIQTQDVNDKLDQVIDEFLCLLCPYFLLKPAQKAMEWLIYRFHIQEFNVNALLRCIFPYHDTNIFARAVQLLQIQDETDRWHWLQPLQDPGVPLSKGALSARCADNPAFMKFLCVMNKKLVQVHGGRSGALEAPVALFAGVLCLALQRTETVTERQVALLAPHVLRCVRSPLTQLRAAGYLLAGQLSRRAGLSAELTARLLTALVEGVDGPLAAEAVAALAVVVHTQAVARLPAGALQLLTASPAPLTGALDRLPGGVSLLPLVSCLLRTCLLEAAGGDSTAAAMATAVAASARIESTSEQQLLIRSVHRALRRP